MTSLAKQALTLFGDVARDAWLFVCLQSWSTRPFTSSPLVHAKKLLSCWKSVQVIGDNGEYESSTRCGLEVRSVWLFRRHKALPGQLHLSVLHDGKERPGRRRGLPPARTSVYVRTQLRAGDTLAFASGEGDRRQYVDGCTCVHAVPVLRAGSGRAGDWMESSRGPQQHRPHRRRRRRRRRRRPGNQSSVTDVDWLLHLCTSRCRLQQQNLHDDDDAE